MRASIFAFATDLLDEGITTVLDNVQARGGLQGVTLACAYHHARDIFPHNPVRRVRFLEGGTLFFRPDPRRYAGQLIQPEVSQLSQQTDPLARLLAESARRDLAVRAWTVYLHNSRLGERYQQCAPRNVFGDPYITNLCPANPDVRAYVRALTADLASRGVTAILAESLSYGSFEHGYHHERSFLPLSPVARYLFGLCFCEHCCAAARRDGVAIERVIATVRRELEAVLDGAVTALPEGEVDLATLAAQADGELGRFIATRQRIVSSLVAEATAAAESAGAARFVMMDMSGATKGYATGQPTGDPAPTIAWHDGLDLTTIARQADGLAAIGYARDPERLRLDLNAYRALLPAERELSVALRPMLPDCDSAANLAAKVAVARECGVAWLDFYHYGFMRLSALDWIREAQQDINQ